MKIRSEKKLKNRWDRERKDYFERVGIGIDQSMNGLQLNLKEIVERDRDVQRQIQCNKIENSRFNPFYKLIKSEKVPKYLDKGWSKGRQKDMANFQIGTAWKGSEYWRKEEERICRVCKKSNEDIKQRVDVMDW